MRYFFSSPIALILALGFLVLSGIQLARTVQSYQMLSSQKQKLENELSDLQVQHREITEELRRMNTPEAIERDGKGRLNLKRPGEDVVVVVPANPTPTTTPIDNSPWGNFKALVSSLFFGWR